MNLAPKHAPWAHQREDLESSKDFPAAALPWEPRCGKTKISIDNAAYLAQAGKIDCALIIAPNGVHLNWTREELPTHWPLDPPMVIEWSSARAGTKRFEAAAAAALTHPGFVWVACNVEAVVTPRLARYLDLLVRRRRTLLIVDESHAIKNPRAKRTKAIMKLSQGCPYRRTLTGTPVSQGPFDLWAQYYVLDPAVLGPRFIPFKNRYGVFKRMRYGSGPAFDELVEYRNLDELRARIAPITFPRRKRDCLDLPPRMMKTLSDGSQSDVLGVPRLFEMPDEHARVYRDLRDELIARLDADTEITAAQALTNLLRLQQISRGHVTLEDRTLRELGSPYPAADACLELVAENPGKSIVWCRFVADVVLLKKVFTEAGIMAIRCDGSVPQDDRPALRDQFRNDPESRVWLGTIGTGGVGVDLSAANLMIFYSHGFDLVQRMQALERNYGSRQTADRLDVVDLVAADTIDQRALAVLEKKENLASTLTVHRLKEILT